VECKRSEIVVIVLNTLSNKQKKNLRKAKIQERGRELASDSKPIFGTKRELHNSLTVSLILFNEYVNFVLQNTVILDTVTQR
jgi:hypothetical protein